jgi:hypothetical protein
MSAKIVMAHLISESAEISALLGAEGQLHVGGTGDDAKTPLLILRQVARQERRTVGKTEAKIMVNSQMRVIAEADDYATVDKLLVAVRKACSNKIGTFAGVTGVSTRAAATGPDSFDAERKTFAQAQDFMVWCHEPGNPAA